MKKLFLSVYTGIFFAFIFSTSSTFAEAAIGTQRNMEKSAGDEYTALDEKLNALYNQIKDKLEKNHYTEAKEDLLKAQRNWVNYRDAECDFQINAVKGGSIAPTIYISCKIQLTKQRIKDFENYLKCNGDPRFCIIPPSQSSISK